VARPQLRVRHAAWSIIKGRRTWFRRPLQINPYLTVMALADRVAEKLRQDLPELRAGG
jgi:hypothetical protein